MRRRVFVVLFLAIFVAMAGMGIIAPLMATYAEDLGATGVWLGIIWASFSLSRAVFMPLVANISDRRGRKLFITGGLLIYCLLSLAYTQAWNPQSLAVIRFTHGIGSAMVIPIAMAYVGETSDKGREGRSMGNIQSALFLGLACGLGISGFLNDAYGIDWVFYAMASLTAVAFMLALFFLPESTSFDCQDSSNTQRAVGYRRALADDTVRGLLVFRATSAMAFGGLLAFLTMFIYESEIVPALIDRWNSVGSNDWKDQAGVLGGILLSINVFLTSIPQAPFGRLADKYNKFVLVLIGSVIATAALMMMPIAQNFEQLLLIGCVVGVGSALSMPAAAAIMVKKIGGKPGMGAQMVLFNEAMSLGIICGALTFGVVKDTVGIESIFLVGGLLSLGGTVAFYLLTRREMKHGDIEPL